MHEDLITIEENSPGFQLNFDLSESDIQYLESDIFGNNIEVFYKDKFGKPRIKIGSYAGIIQLSKHRIHFSTKVNTKLFYMLSYLKSEERFLFDRNTPIDIKEGFNFFDVIGRFFLNHLNDILKQGLLKKYIRRSENMSFLKGKLLVKNQINENLIDKSRFFCEYEDVTFDNIENRIVLSALNSLISLIRFNTYLRNELRKFEVILKDFISLVKVYPHECIQVRFNRINQYYEDIIKLSQLILEERFIRSVHKGRSRGFNFIVDMNTVYEEFISKIIEEVITGDPKFKGYDVESQSRFKYLVKGGRITIRPDIVIRKNDQEYPVIIDAKYKKGEPQSDYYQVITYSLALRSSKACCLLYPKTEKRERREDPFILVRNIDRDDSEEVKLYSRSIDLYLNDESGEEMLFEDYIVGVKASVKNILQELLISST
ncbi:MAG: McrC family protein [Promethearchaeota archaeon]